MNVDDIVLKYYDALIRFCSVKIKNEQDRYDIVQDVFLDCLTANINFTSEKYLKNWLYRVTANKIYSKLRRQYRKNLCEFSEDILLELAMTIDVDTICDKVELMDYISKLSNRQAGMIYLHYYCDFTVKEIARLLQVNVGTVKATMFNGREKLRQYYEGNF